MYKLGRNDPCWCGSGKKYKVCHEELDEKIGDYKRRGYIVPGRQIIKSEAQIQEIRKSAAVNIAVLDYVAERIKAGISTEQINTWAHDQTVKAQGVPAPLGYEGFPKSVCTSVNDQVCHGIPSKDTILKEGDIVNVDVSTILNGYYSDSSRMFCIGKVGEEKERLVKTALECVKQGLAKIKPFRCLGDMGQAVNDYARQNGYTVVREIGGHGVGLSFHEEPWVGYTTKKGTQMLMVPGMIFTVEPMINMGRQEIYIDDSNGWTVYTQDKKPSAQWEVMVLVTWEGYEILAY